MDLIKTMLVYMMLVVGSATEAYPAVTPPVLAQPTTAPAIVETAAPALAPTLAPTAAPTMPPRAYWTPNPTAVPTATPTKYTTLYVGDRGEDVRKLQRRLAELNYLTDKIDGVYGQKTKRAVERFQYYNNLTVDGIAGKATQQMLYENPNVVVGPPDVPGSATATPAPAPRGVVVPVYYVDQNGKLLARADTTIYTTTTIYANAARVGVNYTLTSPGSATVTVRNGVASPGSVTFKYRYTPTPTQAPAVYPVPVYYMTDTGVMLYQTSANVAAGSKTNVFVDTGLVPAGYQLISNAAVAITMDSKGIPFPAAAVFTFRTPAPQPDPEEKTVLVPIRYVNENGFLLNESTVEVQMGQSMAVYANPMMVESFYRLVSLNPVTVSVSSRGIPAPAVVVFTYAYENATVKPTRTPTSMPTMIPVPTTVPVTEAPVTQPPTAVPVTEAPPTAVPVTEAPPTAVPVTEAPPTQAPTAVPPPTQAPTPAPGPQQPLTKAGSTVRFNGDSYKCSWYVTPEGEAMIGIEEFCKAVGLSYYPGDEFFLLGAYCNISQDYYGINSFRVAGKDCTDNIIAWGRDLYVGKKVFTVVGCSFSRDGDVLSIRYK